MQGVRPDEVLCGLGVGQGVGMEAKDICKEKVKGIWKHELAWIGKEVCKTATRNLTWAQPRLWL
jgi:hypothetical protein